MKYAIHYEKDFRYFSEIDEVIFDYTINKDLSALENILPLRKTVILRIPTTYSAEDMDKTLPAIQEYAKKFNIIIQCSFREQKELVTFLKHNNISFMFRDYATDFSTVYAMKNLGVKDIYIAEDLCFSLDKLQTLRENGIRLRVFPNIAQIAPGCNTLVPEITKFWIRPEDTELYEDYIDVMEFYPPLGRDRTSVLFEIYKKRQWLGDIKDLILSYNDSILNTTIAPHFGKMRINCGKKCMYNNCNICLEIANLAKKFNEANLYTIKKKYKEEIPNDIKEQTIEKLKNRGKELIKNEISPD